MPKDKTERLDLRVSPYVKAALMQQARMEGISMAAMIENALYDYMLYHAKQNVDDLNLLFNRKRKERK